MSDDSGAPPRLDLTHAFTNLAPDARSELIEKFGYLAHDEPRQQTHLDLSRPLRFTSGQLGAHRDNSDWLIVEARFEVAPAQAFTADSAEAGPDTTVAALGAAVPDVEAASELLTAAGRTLDAVCMLGLGYVLVRVYAEAADEILGPNVPLAKYLLDRIGEHRYVAPAPEERMRYRVTFEFEDTADLDDADVLEYASDEVTRRPADASYVIERLPVNGQTTQAETPAITATFELVGDDREAMKTWVLATLKTAKAETGFELDDWSLDPHDGHGPR